MTLKFQVSEEGDGSFLEPEEVIDHTIEAFDTLLDDYDCNAISQKTYVSGLEQSIQSSPEFIDAYAHLANFYLASGKPKKALDIALRGLGVAHRLIPEGFHGQVSWGHFENRPYLRAMHAAVLAYVRLKKHVDAVQLIDRMLILNPNDNQGVRWLLGSEALSAKNYKVATHSFIAEARSYPPYHYELAYLHILHARWVEAATALRRGFHANLYIAEMIAGYFAPISLRVWHGGNLAEPETAKSYMEIYGERWDKRPDAVLFVRWLFNHSKVLSERAAILDCKERLKWERDVTARVKIVAEEQGLLSAIDDELSREIIVKQTNREGHSIDPWMDGFMRSAS